MKATERQYDQPFFKVVQSALPSLTPADMQDKEKVLAASMNLRFTDLGNLFGFALLKFHRDLSEDQVEDLIDDLGLAKVSELVGEALASALVTDEEASEDAAENPPPNRKARRSRKTG
jgi:hypothetical protein